MVNDGNRAELQSMLADIRETESPGRSGRDFPYAKTVYACFAEIQNLTAEGFTLSTICKYLTKKGALPPGADSRSFCRAFRKERARRERFETQKKSRTRRPVKNDDAGKLGEATGTKQGVSLPAPAYRTHVEPDKGARLNPGNTFEIEPIDPDDLPDFGSLIKTKIERCESK